MNSTKRPFAILTLIVTVLTASNAQTTAYSPALLEVVNAENSFADRAAKDGTKTAFLAFAAATGLMLNSKPENAIESFQKREASDAFLDWRPAWADVSSSGTIGYTTGPWAFSRSKNEAPTAWGEYFTIWKKQADGFWKFQIDLGIQHDKAAVIALNSWRSPAIVQAPRLKVDSSGIWKTVENSFANYLKENGTKRTYERFASDQIRMLREGQHPFQGRSEAVKNISSDEIMFKILGGESVSDLAYVYGEHQTKTADGKTMHGFFTRVWKFERDGWRIAAEVVNLAPEK